MKKEENEQQEKSKTGTLFKLLNFPKSREIPEALIAVSIILLSLISGVTIIMETVEDVYQGFSWLLVLMDLIAFLVFAVEYGLRFVASSANPDYPENDIKQIDFMISLTGIIDLLSIVAIFLSLIIPITNELRPLIRLFHMVVFFKLIRYSDSFEIIASVMYRKKEELLITMILSLLLLFFGSVFMYIAENPAQPEVFTNLFSSMWFTAVNSFTIGYGEIVPITTFGKWISSMISIMGITLFLLPASVIASGFVDEIQSRNPQTITCPQCNVETDRDEFLRDLEYYKRRKRGRLPKIIKKALEAEKEAQPKFELPIQRKKQKIYNLLEFRYPQNVFQFFIFVLFATLIAFNVLTIMAETNPILYQELKPTLLMIYLISALTFTIEFLVRLWSCSASDDERYSDTLKGKLNFIATPKSLVDILIIVVLYISFFVGLFSNATVDILLLLRLFIVFKIGHFLAVFELIGSVFKYTIKEFMTTIFICVMFLIISSTIIYHFETVAQPEKFSSISSTLWFGIATFTTTGFGDMYPITTAGRFTTICFSFLGVALFTLPAGILGGSFFSSLQEFRLHRICPECGFVLSRPKISKKRIKP